MRHAEEVGSLRSQIAARLENATELKEIQRKLVLTDAALDKDHRNRDGSEETLSSAIRYTHYYREI